MSDNDPYGVVSCFVVIVLFLLVCFVGLAVAFFMMAARGR